MQETSHNVEAAVDRGVNDPSTDKCKVIFYVLMCLFIFLEFSCAPICLACSFFYSTPLRVLQVIPTFFVTVV